MGADAGFYLVAGTVENYLGVNLPSDRQPPLISDYPGFLISVTDRALDTVCTDFATRFSSIDDFCSVQSSLGIPFGTRNWRFGKGCSEKAARFSPASGRVTMSLPRLLTQRKAEAMHVQGDHGQSNGIDFAPLVWSRTAKVVPREKQWTDDFSHLLGTI